VAASNRGGRTWSKGPNKLSASYRARLTRAGITREQWLAGANLQTARGHKYKPPGAAPSDATDRLVSGAATQADVAAIDAWHRPAWLPQSQFDMSDDVAAALSQLGNPRGWGHIAFTPAAEGRPWTMTVTPTRYMDGDTVLTHAYDRTVQIPGGGGSGTTGAREVLDWLVEEDRDFDVMGTI
jgi:hypothetical protein